MAICSSDDAMGMGIVRFNLRDVWTDTGDDGTCDVVRGHVLHPAHRRWSVQEQHREEHAEGDNQGLTGRCCASLGCFQTGADGDVPGGVQDYRGARAEEVVR